MSTYKGRVNKKNKKVNQQSVQPAKFSIRHFCQEPDCPVELMLSFATHCGAGGIIPINFPVAKSLRELLDSAASMIAMTVKLNLPLLPGQPHGKPLMVQLPLQTGEGSLHRIPPPTREDAF